MTNPLICPYCQKPIRGDQMRIAIPDDCGADVGYCGDFHHDCGILAQLDEDGLSFEETVTRLFNILCMSISEWDSLADEDARDFPSTSYLYRLGDCIKHPRGETMHRKGGPGPLHVSCGKGKFA